MPVPTVAPAGTAASATRPASLPPPAATAGTAATAGPSSAPPSTVTAATAAWAATAPMASPPTAATAPTAPPPAHPARTAGTAQTSRDSPPPMDTATAARRKSGAVICGAATAQREASGWWRGAGHIGADGGRITDARSVGPGVAARSRAAHPSAAACPPIGSGDPRGCVAAVADGSSAHGGVFGGWSVSSARQRAQARGLLCLIIDGSSERPSATVGFRLQRFRGGGADDRLRAVVVQVAMTGLCSLSGNGACTGRCPTNVGYPGAEGVSQCQRGFSQSLQHLIVQQLSMTDSFHSRRPRQALVRSVEHLLGTRNAPHARRHCSL